MKVIVYKGTIVTPSGTFKPGDKVDLPDDEAARLIELSVVHRPSKQYEYRSYRFGQSGHFNRFGQ
jgi:hypothetical protein